MDLTLFLLRLEEDEQKPSMLVREGNIAKAVGNDYASP
jgi:hypothetical protein